MYFTELNEFFINHLNFNDTIINVDDNFKLFFYFNYDKYMFFNFILKFENLSDIILINQNQNLNLINNLYLNVSDNFFFKNLNNKIKFDKIDFISDNLYLDNVMKIYHYSIPNTRLYYPEPFLAAPSFMHNDLWFLHILIYQYWLWFVFIFLIVFFFISFISVIRWCNLRIRPRRETRGVSRSKCGDLITASVPVSWAISIIVQETTDAIDFFDGFNTTEMVIGIRAYQWGWEYYYPKDIDLNYQLKPNYSLFLGNSLKYNKTTEKQISHGSMWGFYQNKMFDSTILPAYIFLLPIDNFNLINQKSLNNIGVTTIEESNSFKQSRKFSKIFIENFDNIIPISNNYYNKINNYLINNYLNDSSSFKFKRQNNLIYNQLNSNSYQSFFDIKSINKFFLLTFKNLKNQKFKKSMNYNYNNFINYYFPSTFLFYDYSFKDMQFIELFEDIFWESSLSLFYTEEYFDVNDEFYDYDVFTKFDKEDQFYISINRFKLKNDQVKFNFENLFTPFYFNVDVNCKDYNVNSIFLENSILPVNLLSLNYFFLLNNYYLIINNIDDTYDNLKNFQIFNFLNHNYNFLLQLNFWKPYSYSTVSNVFYSNFDDISFTSNNIFLKKINEFYFPQINNFLDFMNEDSFELFNNNSNLINFNNFSMNSYLQHRKTSLNSIKMYNAMKKVFRARFDESRSNTKLIDLSNSYVKQPYMMSSTPDYVNMIGKNKQYFFNINFFNQLKFFFNNNYSFSFNSLNYYYYDFPFLVSNNSDSARYIWFDWFAKWGMVDVKPSSASRYNLYGMPFLKKTSFNLFNETENYFTRISHSRKNFLLNWTCSYYFLLKNNFWYKYLLLNTYNLKNINLLNLDYLFNHFEWFWNPKLSLNKINYNNYFNTSSSYINSFGKTLWQLTNSYQSFSFFIIHLIDILEKREYLYRQFFYLNFKTYKLPITFLNSTNNLLINEVKTSYNFSNSFYQINEFSRFISYQYFFTFNNLILENNLKYFYNLFNLNSFLDRFFILFFNQINTNYSENYKLLKNQYRPFKKGILNMVRLHATGAIALPIETRLQVLASSQDVIHSWAVPSAGVKIDCVPGFSSHRVIIFLLSGIFWGQCMEICGRYHHWMPIVIYFMKRDLFFIWCLHFVFLSENDKNFILNNQNFLNKPTIVSFNKLSWVNEL